MNKTKLIISWILRGLLAIGFLLASAGKLTNSPFVIEMFENWGYPSWFHFFIGILEFSFAILLMIPKTLKLAIAGFLIILIGAVFTHLINDPAVELIRPLIFLIVLGGVFYMNFYVNGKVVL